MRTESAMAVHSRVGVEGGRRWNRTDCASFSSTVRVLPSIKARRHRAAAWVGNGLISTRVRGLPRHCSRKIGVVIGELKAMTARR